MSQIPHQETESLDETQFLTPEQRFEIVADILATIALRVVTQNHEKDLHS